MPAFRLIGRLDIKSENLIKGMQMEGLRVIGKPAEFASKYYADGIDEIWYQDIVASLYSRSILPSIMKETAKHIFLPITIGGGVRSLDDCKELFNAGADRVAINSAAIRQHDLIEKVATRYGAQAMSVSIECKNQSHRKWEAFCDAGREKTGYDVIDWAKECENLGAGELLVTSIDRDGTLRGIDWDLAEEIRMAVNIPVIISGGFASEDELSNAKEMRLSGIAIGRALHEEKVTISSLRDALVKFGMESRIAYGS